MAKLGMLVVAIAVLLGGCAGIDVHYGEGRRMVIEHETNVVRPSFTKVTTEVCVPDERVKVIETTIDGTTYRCQGVYVATVPNFAAQEGAATGLGSAVVLGGAAVGTGYYIGKGIGDSGDSVTNNNDTSSNGGTQSQGQKQGQGQKQLQKASSRSSAKGGAGGKGGSGGMGGSVNNGMPMAGRD